MPLLRPLLGFSRADLRGHCAAASVPWLEDRSNADLRHRRNYLRRVVLPGLEQGVPGLTAELVALAGRSRGEAQDLDSAALAAWGHALGSDGLRLAEILAEPLALRRQLWRRLLLHLGVELERSRLMRVDDLAHGAVGRRLHLGPWLLLRRRHTIAWERAQPQLSAEEVAIPAPGDYRRGDAWLSCRRIPRPSGAMAAGNQAWLDADRCGWPLSWRPATGQDRFTPLGAPGRQTVAKFLSSRGVPSRLRHGAAVVADREGVVWVPGLSIADRVRVGPSTTTVLHLEWEPSCGTDRAPTVPNRQDHTDASR
jgi:tRNA(Ile)-lysidine synthase